MPFDAVGMLQSRAVMSGRRQRRRQQRQRTAAGRRQRTAGAGRRRRRWLRARHLVARRRGDGDGVCRSHAPTGERQSASARLQPVAGGLLIPEWRRRTQCRARQTPPPLPPNRGLTRRSLRTVSAASKAAPHQTGYRKRLANKTQDNNSEPPLVDPAAGSRGGGANLGRIPNLGYPQNWKLHGFTDTPLFFGMDLKKSKKVFWELFGGQKTWWPPFLGFGRSMAGLPPWIRQWSHSGVT